MARLIHRVTKNSRMGRNPFSQFDNQLDILSLEDTSVIRGGDKEYKPIYEDIQDETRIKFTDFFKLF